MGAAQARGDGMSDHQDVLDFWFGGVSGDWGGEGNADRWFRSSAEFDAEIAARFGGLVESLPESYRSWLGEPLSGLAAVIALDQFPRNIFRGTAKAFAFDSHALDSCLSLIESGAERSLLPVQRLFLYMPLEHSEDLAMQELCVSKFGRLAEEAPEEHRKFAEGNLGYAKMHLDLIRRFGRFPHRNGLLGRAATPEEIAYLEGGGETFGQKQAG